jgi:putative transposase
VQYFNRAYGRSGTLWEGRYRATVVDSAHYLFTVMRYIELNPLRAGMVAQPEDYLWSSYRHNALGEGGPNFNWLSPHEEYLGMGASAAERQAAYRALFATQIDNVALAEIRETHPQGLGTRRSRLHLPGRGPESETRRIKGCGGGRGKTSGWEIDFNRV